MYLKHIKYFGKFSKIGQHRNKKKCKLSPENSSKARKPVLFRNPWRYSHRTLKASIYNHNHTILIKSACSDFFGFAKRVFAGKILQATHQPSLSSNSGVLLSSYLPRLTHSYKFWKIEKTVIFGIFCKLIQMYSCQTRAVERLKSANTSLAYMMEKMRHKSTYRKNGNT